MFTRRRSSRGVECARLLDELDRAVHRGPALVVAPAGFGKTTLLAHHADRHDGPVAAYLAEPAHPQAGDPIRPLLRAIHEAAGASDANEGADEDMMAAGAGPAGTGDRSTRAPVRDGAAAAVTAAMTAAVRRSGAPLLVTIDNVDAMIGTPVEAVIEQVLARRPQRVHVVLAGRRMPRLNLFRYEVADGPSVIGPDQLRLRSWEVERLFDAGFGEPLGADDAAQLTRLTGGWPAGLAMFHFATRGQSATARHRAVASLSGRWPVFRQYFADTVLSGLPAPVLDFLLRTSVLEQLTAARCDALLGRPGADRMLDELAGRYGLPLTVHGDVYHYQPALLRAHLLTALRDQLGPLPAADWHRRAAELLVAASAYDEAARALVAAGDWSALHDLLAEHGAAAVDGDEPDSLLTVPPDVLAGEGWLRYADARRSLRLGQVRAAVEGFAAAEALLPASERGRCAEARASAETWLPDRAGDPLDGTKAPWSAGLRETVRRAPAAAAAAGAAPARLPSAAAELARLVAAVLAGDLRDAPYDAPPGPAPRRDEPAMAVLGLRVARVALRVAAGAAAPTELERAADEAESAGLPWLARVAVAARALTGEPDATAEAHSRAADSRRRGDRWGYLLAGALGCIGDQRQGALVDPRLGALAEQRLSELAEEAQQLDAGVPSAWAVAFAALTQARHAGTGAAELARTALALAAETQVPGAAIAATVALAVAEPARRVALLAEAASRAGATGLPPALVRFWAGPIPAARVGAQVGPVTIHCFGGFRMQIEGRPVDLAGVRARARRTLRLLAIHTGQLVHRERLVEALWPDLPPAAALRNLQVAISALRGALEPHSGRGRAQLLVRSGDAYGLILPPEGYADTAAFTAAVRRWQHVRRTGSFAAHLEAMTAVLAEYGGDLLPEDGPADWVVEPREYFRQQATLVARELAVAQLARGEVAEAVRAAERCIALDPHDDEAWQVLLRAYARGGSPGKAADARRRYAAMLASLGVTAAAPARSVRTPPAPHPTDGGGQPARFSSP